MMKYIKIGNIELGVDGNDTYYQVSSNEDAVDYDSVFNDAMISTLVVELGYTTTGDDVAGLVFPRPAALVK